MSTPILITMPKYVSTNNGATLSDTFSEKVSETRIRGKKRRLEHLSWEEKMQRKKLKNRVAAQNSRDRKKAKMDEMEYSVQILKDQNETLVAECQALRELNERLLAENAEIRKQFSSPASQVCSVCCGPAKGPAVSAPLQKEHGPQQAAALWLAIVCLLYQTSSMKSNQILTSINLKNSPEVSYKILLETAKQVLNNQRLHPNVPKDTLVRKWWGRHQKTWNPVEIVA